jgi:hypothetical protein
MMPMPGGRPGMPGGMQPGGMIPGYQPGMQPSPQPGYGLPQLPVNGGGMNGRLSPAMLQAMMQMLQRGGGMR